MSSFLSTIGIRTFVDLGNAQAGFATIRREAMMTTGSLRSLSGAATAASNPITRFGQVLNTVGGNVRTFGNMISNLGLRMAALVSAPAIFAGWVSLRDAAEFEATLVKTINLAGETAVSVEAAGEAILGLAPAVGQLPTDLLEAFFFIASSGLPATSDFLNILEVSAKGAAVGLGDVATVGDLTTSIIATFGITAEEAVDQFIVAVREGKGEVEDFAGTMGRALAFGKLMGVSFAELSAAIILFTRFGIDASVATTGFRAAITSLMNPTKEATDTLAEFGFSIERVHEMIADPNIGLARTLLTLDKAFGGSAVTWGKVIGNVRGLAEVLTLVGVVGEEEYLRVVSDIENSNGVLAESFERVTGTLEFQMASFKSVTQVLAISIGQALLPVVNELLVSLIPVVATIAEWIKLHPGIARIAAAFAAIVAAIGPLMFLFGAFVATIGTAITAISTFVATFGSLTLLMTGPIIAAVMGVVAVFAIFAGALAATADDIEKKAGPAFDSLANKALRWGENIIISLANGIIKGITAVINALSDVAEVVTYWLRGQSPPRLLPHLTDWGEGAINAWLEGWTKGDYSLFQEIAEPIEQLLRSIGSAQGAERTDIASAILGSREAIAAAVEQYRELGQISEETMAAITSGLGDAASVVPAYIQNLVALEQASQRVADAQARLNEITTRYEERLRPLNDRLKQIRDTQDEWRRQQRETELQGIIDDRRAPEFVKDRARLLLEELNLERQIAAIESQKDTEVSAAERELELARQQQEAVELQLEATRDLIDLIAEQNRLMAETIELQRELATPGVPGGGAGGGGGADGDLGGEGITPTTPITGGGGGLGLPSLDNLPKLDTGALSDAWERIKEAVEPSIDDLNAALERFSTAIAGVVVAIDDLERADLPGVLERIFNNETVEKVLAVAAAIGTFFLLKTVVVPAATSIAGAFGALSAALAAGGIAGALGAIVSALGGPVTLAIIAVSVLVGLLIWKWDELVAGWEEFVEQAEEWWSSLKETLGQVPANFDQMLSDIGKSFSDAWGAVVNWWNENIVPWVQSMADDWQKAKDDASTYWETIRDTITTAGDKIREKVEELRDKFFDAWDKTVEKIEEAEGNIVTAWENLKTKIGELRDDISGKIEEVRTFFEELPGKIETALRDLGTKIGAAFTAAKNALVGENGPVRVLIGEVVGWFVGLPGAIAATLGIETGAWGPLVAIFSNIGALIGTAIAGGLDLNALWLAVKNTLENLKSRIEEWVRSWVLNFLTGGGGNPDQPASASVPSPGMTTTGLQALIPSPPVVIGASSTSTVNMGGQIINNGLDAVTLAALVRQAVSRSI